ncbi:TonB-dependent receptor [Croceicoccus sp. YJ47]|uniref:TonB-dependent receptor n=1 Tax=Croceicoccus sp. YJ47 TaxID=2798724 RepID=UPI0019219E74|nr:TonB-dependent receptor [Croceicoccus sp. YJ47]QQN75071.1 TonB-dependent receptor [Croceicoccus sp. YJ47]
MTATAALRRPILCLGAMIAGTATANAQTAPVAPAAPVAADAIVVTAGKGDTGALDYPGHVAAYDAAMLNARQFRDLSSLTYAEPNVSLDPIGTFAGVANFSIRGLGVNSSIPSIDPAVGLFVDGVYVGINAGTVFDALDVSSVEILRGPQGVLFGRNTTGGAVLVETGDPSFRGEGHAGITFETPVDGDRGAPMATARAVVSGPLSDRLAIRLGALHTIDGGYFRNGFNDSDFGAARTSVLRGGLTFVASERLTITAKGEWHDSAGDGAPTQNHGQHSRYGYTLAVDEEGFYDSRSDFAVLRGEYLLGNGRLTNIFGWRQYDLRTRNDIDSSAAYIFHSNTGTSQEQFSNELFWTGALGRAKMTAGGYVFTQDVAYDEDRSLPPFSALNFYGGGRQDHDVYGLYAQADYPVATRLTLGLGLRWSREEKRADISFVRPRNAPCFVTQGTCPFTGTNPVTGEDNGFSDARAWNSLSPRIALSYAIVPVANAYASWTRGHRSGGYNLRVTQPAAFQDVADLLGSAAFDEERVDSFEAGFKYRSPGGRAALTLAAFWTEVDDLQREVSVASVASGLAQSVYNTADARIRGGEIAGHFAVSPIVTIRANAGYIDAQYRRVFQDISGDGVIDGADRALALPRVPEWTYGAGAVANLPVPGVRQGAMLTAGADFQHRDRYAYTDNNFGYVDAFDNLDASIGIDLGDPGIRLTLFGRNLLDNVQFGGDTQIPFAAGPFSDGENTPFDPAPAAGTFSPLIKGRRVGVELAFDW